MGLPKLKKEILNLLPSFPRGPGKIVCDQNSRSRIIDKDGKVQICLDQISLGKKRRFLRNPFTTFLDLKWRWVLIIFSIGFILTWLLFAGVYYIISDLHGDLENSLESTHVPCLNNVDSFSAAFLFSLETQHTIGYGSRNPTSECSIAVFTVYVQFIIGVAVQCVTAGLVVAKLQLGKRNSKTVMFSEKACVGRCNDNMCLMVRIGNAGTSELVNAKGYGVVIERHKLNTEDEILAETIIEFVSENGSANLNLLWPAVIHCQVMDNQSAFIKKLQSPHTELIIIVEGVLVSTGQNVQLRTSYLSHELEIGKQFVDISPQLVKIPGRNTYHHLVDYSEFNDLLPDEQWDYGLSSK